MVSRETREPTEIDGVRAEEVTFQDKTVRVVQAWDIASRLGDWTDAVQEAIRKGCDILVVRGFSVRD
jgi:hypothetical protein